MVPVPTPIASAIQTSTACWITANQRATARSRWTRSPCRRAWGAPPRRTKKDTEEHESERCECDPHDPAHCPRSPVSDGDVDDGVDHVHHIGHRKNVGINV